MCGNGFPSCHPHSANTEAQYYQAIVGDRHTVTAYRTMTALQEGDSGGKDSDTKSYISTTNCDESSASTPLQKRRSYSTKETQLVREYVDIARGQSVSLRECAKFLSVHQMDMSEKNIQDNKVKSLLKALPA